MNSLKGKRVLLIAPRFFGYDREIRHEIERRGAVVDLLADRPFDTPLMTAVTKLKPEWVQPAATRSYQAQLSDFGASHYDIILVVNGQTLSGHFLRNLRADFPKARLILYMWDSLENRQSVVRNLPIFDSTFSFDPANCAQYGMHLRPLFFSSGFERPPSQDFDYHISFVGTAHTDRYAVIKRLSNGLSNEIKGFWYLYLQAPWVYQAYRLGKPAMRGASKSEFQFTPLDSSKLQSVFARSRAILDIEHPQQRGLTMRTFETMGSHKKLVTTNTHVRESDFFETGNIFVIDRLNPRIPESFLETPYVPYHPDIYRRYCIAGWADEVLCNA